ncbi:MAG: nucleotide sugar dehydrogenase [Candidatus Ranarchaeia archaeon]
MHSKISVAGAGYVGLVTGVGMAVNGFKVNLSNFIKPEIGDMIEKGIPPFYEKDLEELLKKAVNIGNLKVIRGLEESIQETDITLICEGTPMREDGSIDLQYIERTAKQIGNAIKIKDDYHLVVVKSTVIPGTTRNLVGKTIEKISGKEMGKDFGICMSPEFLREGCAVEDTLSTDRIVIGEFDKRSGELLEKMYKQFYKKTNPPLLRMSIESAEVVKYASNSFLATKISYANELANICEKINNVDVKEVVEGMGLDFRINKKFLGAGVGYGGSCFEGDTMIFATNSSHIHPQPIGDMFSKEVNFQKNGTIETLNPKNNMKVFAFDLISQDCVLSDVIALTRRWYEGDFIEIKTRMGRKLRVTNDHPVIRYKPKNRKLETVLAYDIKKGDYLITVMELPELKKIKGINLLEKIRNHSLSKIIKVRPYDNSFIEKFQKYIDYVPKNIMKYKYDLKRQNCMSLELYYYLLKNGHLDIDVKNLRFFTALGNTTYCPAYFEFNEELMRLLGYYAAEGWISIDYGRNDIPCERVGFSFGSHEKKYIQDLHNILDNLGIRYITTEKMNAHQTTISSKVFAYFIRDVLGCGVRSETKSIPKMIFHMDPVLKKAFLQGAWSGDGCVSKLHGGRNLVYEYGTVSKKLAEGMILLLQSLGIIPSMKQRMMNKSKHLAHIIKISGIEQMEMMKDLFGSTIKKEIEDILNKYERRIKPCGYEKLEGFASLKVTEVKTSSSKEFVYSMETKASTLLANSGLVVHNCFPKDVNALVSFSKSLDILPVILESVVERNRIQSIRAVDLLEEMVGDLGNKTISLLGLSFKPDTDDMREAPSVKIVKELKKRGVVKIVGTDPHSIESAKEVLKDEIEYVKTSLECIKDTDGCILVTEWDDYKKLKPEDFINNMRDPVLVDGRRIYNQEIFDKKIKFRAIGLGPIS